MHLGMRRALRYDTFQRGMLFCARQADLSSSEIADLLKKSISGCTIN